MTESSPHIVWLRRDLRLHDNPALNAAAAGGQQVIPVFIDDPDEPIGGAARWWRGQSLASLDADLGNLGSRLVLRQGSSLDQIMSLIAETGAGHLHFNRRLEPDQLRTDAAVLTEARGQGIDVHEHDGNRLHAPWTLKTLKGDPYRVFTPFWRRLAESYCPPKAWPDPARLTAPKNWPKSLPLSSFQEQAGWADGMARTWQPGETGARTLLDGLPAKLDAYHATRDQPQTDGTSRLSPHLAWGEISVHEIWRRLAIGGNPAGNGFLRELGWRDFNSHLLYHFPELPTKSWSHAFRQFPYQTSDENLAAWQEGRTGFPLVDAGMRQLWQTGWMHNRVRMIAASFLIKDLLIDWRHGQAWFWDTLVDADLAQNAGNWQWVAGSGADAAPYFRIFNPTVQSLKFDAAGEYIRRFVPELGKLPARYIHAPETAPADVLAAASLRLGTDYPRPIVDHAEARRRALDIYQTVSKGIAPVSAAQNSAKQGNLPL